MAEAMLPSSTIDGRSLNREMKLAAFTGAQRDQKTPDSHCGQIKAELDEVHGTSAPAFTTIYDWVNEFKRGRTSTNDERRSGRPVEVTTPEMIDKTHNMVLSDRRIKVPEIVEITDISQETKEQSKQWVFEDERAPKEAKTGKSVNKMMATVFWNARGIICTDHLEKGKTITGENYASLLHWLSEEIKKKTIHQDNAWGTSRANDNGGFDFEKYGACVDRMKPFLGPSLENRIYSGLEEFVCKPNSPASNRFPCVNRCLDAAVAWVDYLDTFCAKNADAREEMIKHAIEYLVKDGLVTHFVDPDGLNNRVNRIVCREFDSSTPEQNVLKSMSVWAFINEKNYWLCQDCANTDQIYASVEPFPIIDPHNSDLEVEVGSITKEVPGACNVHEKCPNRYSPDQRIINAESPDHSSQNTKNWHTTTACNCTQVNIPRRPSKLKVFFHKTTNTSQSRVPCQRKLTSLSIPCKPSQLIVRIFEADPSLSDSCLILMKKKFENSVRNACSCINEILGKLDEAVIRELRLGCEIRSGRIDLSLRRSRTSKDRLFLARLPTCRGARERDKHRGIVDRRECLQPGVERLSEDLEVGRFAAARSNEKDGGGKQKRVTFYSPCSDNNSMEEKGTNNVSFEECCGRGVVEKQVDFAWTKKTAEVRTDEVVFNFRNPFFSLRRGGPVVGDSKSVASMESSDSNCGCFSDSLREEEDSLKKVCSPQQCFCHVFEQKEDDEREDCAEVEHFEGDRVEEVRQAASKTKGAVSQIEEGIRKEILEREEGISKIETRRSGFDTVEKYSDDTICPLSSSINDTKCSCCGNDISDSETTNIEPENIVFIDSNETTANIEIFETSSLRCSEETKDIPSTIQPLEFKMSSIANAEGESIVKNQPVREFVFNGYPRKCPEICEQNLIEDNDDQRVDTNELACRSNAFTDRESISEDLCPYMSREGRSMLRESKRCTRYANCTLSRSTKNLRKLDAKTKKESLVDRKAKEEDDLSVFSRYKSRFWRGSIVPGNLCRSFPTASIDRIKYLIRKKLRRLLLEERDKGTSTSKTFLKDDRYLVSVSSGKLTGKRIMEESHPDGSSSNRCPFTARNRARVAEPEQTFAESSFERRKNEVTEDSGKKRSQKIIDGDILKKIGVLDVSRHYRTHKSIDAGSGTSNCRTFYDYSSGRRSNIASFGSKELLFVEDDVGRCSGDVDEKQMADHAYFNKLLRERGRNSKEENFAKQFNRDFYSNRTWRRSRKNYCGCESFDESREDDVRSFEKHLFKFGVNRDEDLAGFRDYERCMNELSADFRSKLLEYVELCRSVKDSLIKRLRSDDVYEVTSSSV
ncbi:uncharacterized protein LOC122397414 [Colletes gigas]|uniref:uncharacterized protein LOC122397414 n=1 Tax=Colletes gigas TaxID=935657 RepID=UPI001C9B18B1|nr:uncharacterized protein LOC122397414 [Colletes gigas]